MTNEGQSATLDAFAVALSQACVEGKHLWYMSALELQLVSLEFCRVCRGFSTLHIRVNQETPRNLCYPWKSNTAPNDHAAEVRISSRVPVVSPFGLM
ncbi:unnamed protein product [Ectocarpus fasciculatus]